MGSYVPSTHEERHEMLSAMGLKNIEDLFADVPKDLMLAELNIPEGMSELEVRRSMTEIAKRNRVFPTIFRGAGAYRHYIPSLVKQITSKEEFVTAYTPYQAEISQGILQSIFEYQTMIAELTGMEVSNASVYDGATAAAESITMCRERKRVKAYVSETVNPQTLQVMRTYCFASDTELVVVPAKEGRTDLKQLESLLTESAACFYMEQPNFYGLLEDAEAAGKIVHDAGAKFVMGVNPISLGILKTPFECGADIAVGEGQPLGIPLSYGGPYLGFMATTKALMRKLPGRIVGETVDLAGKRAYVLTLQAREQHIRREKATSSICSNQALCAMTAAVYMAVMGPRGLRETAEQCYSKAHYAAEQIGGIRGFELKYKGEFFHEFLTECPCDPELLVERLAQEEILGGYPIAGEILWCVTELNTKEEIDRLAAILKEVASA